MDRFYYDSKMFTKHSVASWEADFKAENIFVYQNSRLIFAHNQEIVYQKRNSRCQIEL